MANTKSKKTTAKKSTSKAKAVATKSEKTVKAETATTSAAALAKGGNPFKGFFAKKCDKDENILTIFKSPRIWGAVAGELVGTMLLTILMLSLVGVTQPLYVLIGGIGITMAVYAFSGAHLNPAVTVGMMASRRVSAIRGVLYIVAQVVGAWLGLIILSGLKGYGAESAMDLPTIAPLVADKTLWPNIFIEFLGASIVGYFFCRAQSYKTSKGAFTYAALVAGGLALATLVCVVISMRYTALYDGGLNPNFELNPAIAIMEQIFPTTANDVGSLFGDIALAALTFIIVPMLGSVVGFAAADASKKLAGED
jgi:glycerol uptake facilitator-like aquaporin